MHFAVTRGLRQAWICGALVFCTAGPLQAQTKPRLLDAGVQDPASILYVGQLARAADPKARLRSVSATISGSGFDWHDVESHFRPNAVSA